jgi:uncharacterized protein (DUF433 family)
MATKTLLYNVTQGHILQTPDLCDNLPHIVGTNVTVLDIYEAYFIYGISPEEIAHEKNLDMAQVFAALTFIHDWMPQVKASFERRQKRPQAQNPQ